MERDEELEFLRDLECRRGVPEAVAELRSMAVGVAVGAVWWAVLEAVAVGLAEGADAGPLLEAMKAEGPDLTPERAGELVVEWRRACQDETGHTHRLATCGKVYHKF